MNLTFFWILLNALLYIALGLFTFYKPLSVANTIGFELTNSTAQADLRATYGGLMIALGAFILYLNYKTKPLYALMLILFLYIGFASGRVIGICSNQQLDKTSLFFLVFELIFIAITVIYVNSWVSK